MPIHPNAAPLAGLALRCQPDSRLVALSREGHERAFEEIVRRYRPALVAFAGAIVPAHRAEDVVQDSLTKAHGALAAGDAEIRLKPWLYTIVRNRALNDLRDEPTHEHLDESFDGVPQPPDIAARREELAALTARMKGLPTAQREALVKRELEGRSHTQIASAMETTPGAVRGLIFRARTALRDGAGVLIPLPVVRALLNAGPFQAEATGTGIGASAAGLTAGGGGIAVKAGATVAVAILAVGSGIALHERHGGKARTDTVAIASNNNGGGGHHDRGTTGAVPVSDRSQPGEGSGRSADSGRSGQGPGSSDGPGDGRPGASSDPGGSSPPGGLSGPGGSSDDSAHGGGGHEGAGSGADDGSGGAENESDDGGHQGSGGSGGGEPESGGGGSEHEGGGTAGGGSGSDDSSGSGSDDSSGSGSSGSGSSGSDDGETTGGDTSSGHDRGGDTTTSDDSADTGTGDHLHD